MNEAYCIIWIWLKGNISSTVKYSCLSNFPDDNVNIFPVSLLISYYTFSSRMFSLTIMISSYILSERSDARVALFSEKNIILQYNFLKDL